MSSQKRFCGRCRNHNLKIEIKGHARMCKFRSCKCESCELQAKANLLSLKERKWQRRIKMKLAASASESDVNIGSSRSCCGEMLEIIENNQVGEEKSDGKLPKFEELVKGLTGSGDNEQEIYDLDWDFLLDVNFSKVG